MIDSLLDLVAVKAVIALLLAVAVAGVGLWLRRPALLHVLWIVVLLELFVPPLFEIGVLPRPSGDVAATLGAAVVAERAADWIPAPTAAASLPAARSLAPYLPALALAIWVAGSLLVLLLTATRLRRFRRLLRDTTAAPRELVATARRLAAGLGLRRVPPIRLVRAKISPMLCPRLGRFELLFPTELLSNLEPRERDALVAHELAHLKRRDHWVRWLELAAASIFWWHPVVWWASSRLRHAEEQCCDALVLDTFPDRAAPYARGLVKTVEFLSGARDALPALASGAGGARKLEERLTMIVKQRLPKRASRLQQLLLAAAACCLLLVVPTWADRSSDGATDRRDREESRAAISTEVRESLLALEQEAIALEQELREVRDRQRQLEMELRAEAGGNEVALERIRWERDAHNAAREQALAERRLHRMEVDRMRAEMALAHELEVRDDDLRRLEREVAELELQMTVAREHDRQSEIAVLKHQLERLKAVMDEHRVRLDRAR